MKFICIWLIKFYRRFLSPLKGSPTCRFTPTCSAYALEAFMKRGFFVGMILTVSRICRCNPFCAGGYDPVPEKGFSSRTEREKYLKDLREKYGYNEQGEYIGTDNVSENITDDNDGQHDTDNGNDNGDRDR